MTDKERSEQVAKVMERVCDLCVHPVQATDQDELYHRIPQNTGFTSMYICHRINRRIRQQSLPT